MAGRPVPPRVLRCEARRRPPRTATPASRTESSGPRRPAAPVPRRPRATGLDRRRAETSRTRALDRVRPRCDVSRRQRRGPRPVSVRPVQRTELPGTGGNSVPLGARASPSRDPGPDHPRPEAAVGSRTGEAADRARGRPGHRMPGSLGRTGSRPDRCRGRPGPVPDPARSAATAQIARTAPRGPSIDRRATGPATRDRPPPGHRPDDPTTRAPDRLPIVESRELGGSRRARPPRRVTPVGRLLRGPLTGRLLRRPLTGRLLRGPLTGRLLRGRPIGPLAARTAHPG